MLHNLFERRDLIFSTLTLALIADDAHSRHDIVVLLVLKVRSACPLSILPTSRCPSSTLLEEVDSAGDIVNVYDNNKGQLVSAAGSPLRSVAFSVTWFCCHGFPYCLFAYYTAASPQHQ